MTGGGDKGKEASADEAGFVAQETAHLVLLATGAESTQLTPKVGDVILDIDTTATIASAARVSDYVAQLTPTERSTIRSNEAAAVFTLGGGHKQRAYERVILPMLLGGRCCLVQTWVVARHFPMLLSRKTMASLGVVLDVAARRMVVQDLQVELGLNMSADGHLTFNALDKGNDQTTVVVEPPIEAVRGFTLLAVLTKETLELPSRPRSCSRHPLRQGGCKSQ